VDAVNVALVLERPLLLTGEPGTGKSQLAFSVAWQLAARSQLNVLTPHVERFEAKSTSVARDLFYSFDTLGRFHAEYSKGSTNNADYITYTALGRALLKAQPFQKVADIVGSDFAHEGPLRSVVLIDEIDKAPRDFPNDLLYEIDRMEFSFPELRAEPFRCDVRPVVIITSNNERQLPEPFLRRCVFHRIAFPDPTSLHRILGERLRHLDVEKALIESATRRAMQLRGDDLRLEKKPATGELITWVKMLRRAGVSAAQLDATPLRELPFLGTVIKNQSDLEAVRQSAS
jgi:MoxR-like ATPase